MVCDDCDRSALEFRIFRAILGRDLSFVNHIEFGKVTAAQAFLAFRSRNIVLYVEVLI